MRQGETEIFNHWFTSQMPPPGRLGQEPRTPYRSPTAWAGTQVLESSPSASEGVQQSEDGSEAEVALGLWPSDMDTSCTGLTTAPQ